MLASLRQSAQQRSRPRGLPLLNAISALEEPSVASTIRDETYLAVRRMGLSALAHDRILKVARTIADLDGKDALQSHGINIATSANAADLSRLSFALLFSQQERL